MDSEAGVFAVTFDQSGSRLITCDADKTIKIYKEDDTAVSFLSYIFFRLGDKEMVVTSRAPRYCLLLVIFLHKEYRRNTQEQKRKREWEKRNYSFCHFTCLCLNPVFSVT